MSRISGSNSTSRVLILLDVTLDAQRQRRPDVTWTRVAFHRVKPVTSRAAGPIYRSIRQI
ncbi:MAG: hypothetical protein R2854_07705 [Caldilineaceae bacterium]